MYQSRVNQYQRQIEQSETFRVTALQVFEDCPKRWETEYFGATILLDANKETKSVYANIGTAVHKVIELHFAGKIGELDKFGGVDSYLRSNGVNDKEIGNVKKYIAKLESLGLKINHLEREFILPLLPGHVQIKGHIDMEAYSRDDMITVVDHKTNRQYENEETWKEKFQPRVYALAVRTLYQTSDPIRFIIGYPNQDEFVVFQYTIEDDHDTIIRLNRIWEEILECIDNGEFRPSMNQNCGYCSLKMSCSEFKDNVLEFQNSALAMMDAPNKYETLLKIRAIKSLAEKLEAQLKDEIKDEVRSMGADGAEVTESGHVFSLRTSSTRTLEFGPTYQLLSEVGMESPENLKAIVALIPDLFTVKVGGMDKLAEAIPGFGERMRGIIVPRTAESLIITSLDKKRITKKS